MNDSLFRTGPLAAALLAVAVAGCTPKTDESAPAVPHRTKTPAAIQVSSDPWVLSTDNPGEGYVGPYLGNGYLGTHLGPAVCSLDPTKGDPSFIAGHYIGEKLQSLPPLFPLHIEAGAATYGTDPLKEYYQELRLREGVLVTRCAWESGSGPVQLQLEAALLRQQPDVALLRLQVENRSSGPLSLRIPETTPSRTSGSNQVARTTQLLPLDRSDLVAQSEGGGGWELPAGQKATFALVSQFGSTISKPTGGSSSLPALTEQQVNTWLDDHRKAWARLWESDIEIEGDPEAQQVVRACLFHLWSSIREGSDAGVPPMGLSAASFDGHVFWDMDSWMLPVVLPQHPELARAMLDYRFRTLAGARENARSEGLPGASYAWESAGNGRETLPRSAVFRHGRHVTGDVALALQQYYRATGDRAWLRTRAWQILQATAQNWVARAKPTAGGYVIEAVATPDELAGQVSHSAWTQHVARENLEFAVEAARVLGQPADPRWSAVAKGLTFLRDPSTKLILAYKGFGERTKAKQADALLLAFPGEAHLPDDELSRMYDYYSPRVIQNGPAMTDAIHAIVAARLGRGPEALQRFRESYRPFVRGPFMLFSEKRTRDNLCFLTGASGVLEAVLYGFAGIRLAGKGDSAHPELTPQLPAEWKSLTLRGVRWRGGVADVRILPGSPPKWSPRGGDPKP
jgi:trehalose/maltose hydrolase-like predicted phosphorylase